MDKNAQNCVKSWMSSHLMIFYSEIHWSWPPQLSNWLRQITLPWKNVDLISRGGRGSKCYETLSHKWKMYIILDGPLDLMGQNTSREQQLKKKDFYIVLLLRRRRIKMQSAYLQFKHPNILRTSDKLSPPNFFLGSIIPKTPEIKKFHRLYCIMLSSLAG